MNSVKTETFPNLATEIICCKYGGLAITVTDIKGALQTGIGIEDRENIYYQLIQIAINNVNWSFVEEWLKRPMTTEIING